MSARFEIAMTPASMQVIARNARRSGAIRMQLVRRLGQGLHEIEAHLKQSLLTGGDWRQPREGKVPLAVRSGSLRQSITSEVDQPDALSGYVGTKAGPASAYARMQLDKGDTTILPKRGKYLWIPIADNLNASGIARYSPRYAMGLLTVTGKRALRFFSTKSGGLIAFLPGKIQEDKAGQALGFSNTERVVGAGKYKRGAKKGQVKGLLLFRLVEKVTVQGTDALAIGASDKIDRVRTLIRLGLRQALAGETA